MTVPGLLGGAMVVSSNRQADREPSLRHPHYLAVAPAPGSFLSVVRSGERLRWQHPPPGALLRNWENVTCPYIPGATRMRQCRQAVATVSHAVKISGPKNPIHISENDARLVYEQRFNSKDAVRLNFQISGNQAFYVMGSDIYEPIIKAMDLDAQGNQRCP